MEGPSKGSSMQGGPAHIFLAAPSSLFLFLFRLGNVSIGVPNVSVVVGFVLLLDFFAEDLFAGSTGCLTIYRGIGAVTDFGMYCGALGVILVVISGEISPNQCPLQERQQQLRSLLKPCPPLFWGTSSFFWSPPLF